MTTMINANGIRVSVGCGSCHYKEVMKDGTRVCTKMGIKVSQTFSCGQWRLSDGLRNAGLSGGEVHQRGNKKTILD